MASEMSRVPKAVAWSVTLLLASGGSLSCPGIFGTTSDRVVAVIPDSYQESRSRFGGAKSWQPTFSQDGARVAYAACTGDQRCFVVLDGVAGPEFSWVGHLKFSPDGKHFAYNAETSQRQPTGALVQEFVVVDGRRGPAFATVSEGHGPGFSPDSHRLAYMARHSYNGDWSVCVVDLVPAASDCQAFPEAQIRTVAWWLTRDSKHAFSFDGKRAASTVTEGGEEFLMVGDWRGPGFAEVRGPIFSPDGTVVAYAARDQGAWFVMRGDVREPTFLDVNALAFSPDGKRLAYFAQIQRPPDERRGLVVDGQQGPAFERLFYRPIFSPDGTKVAYLGWKKGSRADVLQVGDKTFSAEGGIGPAAFSSDGRKVGFPARDGRRLLWKEVRVP